MIFQQCNKSINVLKYLLLPLMVITISACFESNTYTELYISSRSCDKLWLAYNHLEQYYPLQQKSVLKSFAGCPYNPCTSSDTGYYALFYTKIDSITTDTSLFITSVDKDTTDLNRPSILIISHFPKRIDSVYIDGFDNLEYKGRCYKVPVSLQVFLLSKMPLDLKYNWEGQYCNPNVIVR
jgi:hypothetical protein